MILANGPVCAALISGSCGAFPANSGPNSAYFSWVLVSQKSLSNGSLSLRLVQKKWDVGAGSTGCRIRCALANEEVGSGSVAGGFLEKELKFSPTFNDYVKVLESVRTDRSKGSGGDEGDVDSRRRSMGRGKSVGMKKQFRGNKDDSEERVNVMNNNSKGERIDNGWKNKELKGKVGGKKNKSNGGWGLVEGHLEKGTAGRISDMDTGNLKNNRNNSYSRPMRTSNFQRIVSDAGKNVNNDLLVKGKASIFRRSKDTQQEKSKVTEVDRLEISRRNNGKMGRSTSSVLRRNFSDENSKITHGEPIEPIGPWPSNNNLRGDLRDHEVHYISNKNSYMSKVRKKIYDYRIENPTEKMPTVGGNNTESNSREPEIINDGQSRNEWHAGIHDSGNNTVYTHSKVNLVFNNASGDVGGSDTDDIAAFKTFEVFTDVRNRPRVLRMEMEERIEEVAKQLNAADINIPQWKFSKILHSAKIKFTDHSILRIVQILGALGNWRRALHVVEWLESRERFQSYKSRYIYTSVLDVLGKARRPIEALNIFHAMRQGLSSYPDLAAYHCIATILGQAGLLKALFDVIDCMQTLPKKKFNLGPLQRWDPRLEPDLVVYHAVLNACVKRKQWEGAFWVLQQLKEKSIKPTNTTYGLIMEVMLACGKYDLVHEFFRKVEKKSIPGVLNYKVLINTLWKEGKTDEAVAAVKDMERRGVVGTASLYYDLARCLCSAGRCQEALLQIKKICKVAKKPLVVTYTGLIQACLNSGSIENAAFLFNEMHKFCSPNLNTCNIMLKAYIDHEMFEEAKDLFQKILDGDYQITNQAGLPRKLAPDKFTFNTMIEGCVQVQKWDDFEDAYVQMLKHKHHFDTRRHIRVVLDACRAGKVQVMESTWKHLVRFQRVPPPSIIKERFCIKLSEDDLAAAISCIDIHDEIEMRAFSENSWLNLLNANVDRFKSDTVLRLTHELDGLSPQKVGHLPVYENLKKACRQFLSDVNTSPTLPHHPEVPCNIVRALNKE